MGLFNRKRINTNKLFSTKEMIELLRQEGYQDYTTECIETPNGIRHRLIPIEESRKKEREIRQADMNNGFRDRISSGGVYRNINPTPKYNDYQSAKGYGKSVMYR